MVTKAVVIFGAPLPIQADVERVRAKINSAHRSISLRDVLLYGQKIIRSDIPEIQPDPLMQYVACFKEPVKTADLYSAVRSLQPLVGSVSFPRFIHDENSSSILHDVTTSDVVRTLETTLKNLGDVEGRYLLKTSHQVSFGPLHGNIPEQINAYLAHTQLSPRTFITNMATLVYDAQRVGISLRGAPPQGHQIPTELAALGQNL